MGFRTRCFDSTVFCLSTDCMSFRTNKNVQMKKPSFHFGQIEFFYVGRYNKLLIVLVQCTSVRPRAIYSIFEERVRYLLLIPLSRTCHSFFDDHCVFYVATMPLGIGIFSNRTANAENKDDSGRFQCRFGTYSSAGLTYSNDQYIFCYVNIWGTFERFYRISMKKLTHRLS